jgi:hypothetical protein
MYDQTEWRAEVFGISGTVGGTSGTKDRDIRNNRAGTSGTNCRDIRNRPGIQPAEN